MAIPIIVVVAVPIFFGLVYVSPFEPPEEEPAKVLPEEPNLNILYFMLFLNVAIPQWILAPGNGCE